MTSKINKLKLVFELEYICWILVDTRFYTETKFQSWMKMVNKKDFVYYVKDVYS